MPDIYTHPNGYTVERDDRGGVCTKASTYVHSRLTKAESNALRDFFLDELGLWRDPETGALVVTGSWNGNTAAVIYKGESLSGMYPYWDAGLEDDAVARWRASITPPPREPQPGEVWRITLLDGSETNAVVGDGRFRVSCIPADRRRILVEADGTMVSDE